MRTHSCGPHPAMLLSCGSWVSAGILLVNQLMDEAGAEVVMAYMMHIMVGQLPFVKQGRPSANYICSPSVLAAAAVGVAEQRGARCA